MKNDKVVLESTEQNPNRVQVMTEFEKEIRRNIYEGLELFEDGIELEDIQLETPLFEPEYGIGLDSLDALEIVTQFSNIYEINFDESDMEDFTSVKTLAHYVTQQLDISKR